MNSSNPYSSWSGWSVLIKLIAVNVAVFLIFAVPDAALKLFKTSLAAYFDVSNWLAVPSGLKELAFHPWTLVTYMFLHKEIFHILINMLWLYWMGSIFLEYLGPKKLISTYILGGLSGALFFIVSFNVFPLFLDLGSVPLLGASASVLAITIGAATLLPDYSIRLLVVNVPLKIIAAITLIPDLVGVSGDNAGGHIAHLGGAVFGFIYIRQLKKGRDLAAWFNRMIDKSVSVSTSKPKRRSKNMRVVSDEDFRQQKKATQEEVDRILEKISKSGYGSLSSDEKDTLFRSSKEQ
jgi:membrane associated rhomboid family serine protease